MNWRVDNINQRVNEGSLVLIIALLSRLTVLVASAIGFTFFSNLAMQHFVFPNTYLDIFGTFDGDWYKNIALFGYPVINHMPSGNWAFFPLYPFLMNIGGTFLFGTVKIPLTTATTLAGLMVSNALFFVCAILFYKLSNLLINNKKITLISVAFFCFWGSSFFYSAVYSESLFMTLALSAFYFLEKGQTTKSTLFGFLAGLARSSGFIVSVPFIYNGLQTRKYRRAILQSLVIFLPYILFNLYGYIATGTFPVRELAQKLYWTPTINYPITVDFLSKNMGLLIFFTIEAILISVPIIYYLFKERISVRDFVFGLDKRVDLKYWALTLVAAVMLVFVVVYAQANSILRYAIIILPMYWVSAFMWSKNSKLGKTLLFLWIVILVIGTIVFASGEPFIL
jgi:Gpi18-like mannosyltransferase